MGYYFILGIIALVLSLIGLVVLFHALRKTRAFYSFEYMMLLAIFLLHVGLVLGENSVFILSQTEIQNTVLFQTISQSLDNNLWLLKLLILAGTISTFFIVLRMAVLTDFNPAFVVGTSFLSGIQATAVILTLQVIKTTNGQYSLIYTSLKGIILVMSSLVLPLFITQLLIAHKVTKCQTTHDKKYLNVLVYEEAALTFFVLSVLVLGIQRGIPVFAKHVPSNFFLCFIGLGLFSFGLGVLKYPFPYRLLTGGQFLFLSVRDAINQQEIFRVAHQQTIDLTGLLSTAMTGSNIVLTVTMNEEPLNVYAGTKNVHVLTVQVGKYVAMLYLRNRGVMITRYALTALVKEFVKTPTWTEDEIRAHVEQYLGFLSIKNINDYAISRFLYR